ncbi:helix-turn-helix domain-containing protein [Methylobacterium goesingense]|uniref:AraC-like DNA-binding protein n=1 Tax=Methylobacterium goesingense TaxID=243690 RepID=A0ABV2L3Q9_9HYPH|nr:helix-turn-helix domain-containing protein [Methylobacterium goesingense]GJD73452.1 Transcriptional activator NphR [Methylobacterium goesingense]
MQTIFSTAAVKGKDRFRLWQDFVQDRVGPIEQAHLSADPFDGLVEALDIGPLRLTRVVESAVQSRVTPATLRRRDEPGSLFILIQEAGVSMSAQEDRAAIQRTGDIMVLGSRPNVHVAGRRDAMLVLELPRERLEVMLGSSRLFTALTIEGNRPATALATAFIQDLVRLGEKLDPDSAARMATIATDLIIAGIADRLAREVPSPLHGTVVVQRAKAYIEAHLGDPTLDPRRLAEGVGVSLRRLQELFHDQGRHIADWIWQRRLEVAAERLTDPGTRHLTIATLAYGCGFSSAAHFARRFRARYAMTPREYRDAGGQPAS